MLRLGTWYTSSHACVTDNQANIAVLSAFRKRNETKYTILVYATHNDCNEGGK